MDALIVLISAYGINVNAIDFKRKTPLHYAVKNVNLEIVKALIMNANVNINIPDNKGNTALIVAVKYGFLDIIHFLLTLQNIDVNHQNQVGVNLFYFPLSFTMLLRTITHMKLNYFNHIPVSIPIFET